MKRTWWASKDWNALCDECGFKFKASTLKKRWDGLMVCMECYEIRHPQELIRPIPDQTKLPWTRPEPSDTFVTGVCTGLTRQGIADYGTADCAMADLDLGLRNTLNPVT